MTTFKPESVAATRATMGKFLGEIITAVVGTDRIQKLFEDAGKHPDEYKDVPTGDIALKLGVITPNTKTGLLMAQAAERTARLAEDIRSGKNEEIVPFNDKRFAYVGSEGDPKELQYAQALWMGAQMLHNERAHVDPTELKEYVRGFLPGSDRFPRDALWR